MPKRIAPYAGACMIVPDAMAIGTSAFQLGRGVSGAVRENPRMTRRVALIGLATLSLPARSRAQASPSMVRLTSSQMREDLLFLRTQWAPLDRSFSTQQRVAFDQVIDEAIANCDTRSMQDFVLDIMLAVAIPHNGHTTPHGVGRMLGPLPIRTWWFSDGLHVVSAQSGSEDLLGARIDRLGSLTPEDALLRVAPYVSGTEQLRKGIGLDYVTTLGMLRRIGAMGDAEQISVVLSQQNGIARTVQLGAAMASGAAGAHERYALIPDDAGTPDRLLHVLDSLKERPLAYAPEVDMSRAWIGARNDVLYIRSTTLRSSKSRPIGVVGTEGAVSGDTEHRGAAKTEIRYRRSPAESRRKLLQYCLVCRSACQADSGRWSYFRAGRPLYVLGCDSDSGNAEEPRREEGDFRWRDNGGQLQVLG